MPTKKNPALAVARMAASGATREHSRALARLNPYVPIIHNPMPYELTPLPAFNDNYIWWVRQGDRALVVDPGDASPVLQALRAHPGVQLDAILITHHHRDHTGGLAELRAQTGARVIGPSRESIDGPIQAVVQGDVVQACGLRFEVMDVPGHTAGHIAFFCADMDGDPLLFSGDTLFSGGCGRLFEGTPAQMLASLDALATLPGATRVCCAHEYTLSNLRFARAVEPGNLKLASHFMVCEALRADGLPTLPSRMDLEREINPFLRSRKASVAQSVKLRDESLNTADEVAVFAHLREWKNQFK